MGRKKKNRVISYAEAINEAMYQMMAADERVICIGQGVKSPWYVGTTADGLLERFGKHRVIDTPVSENAMTGVAIGAALAGMRPVIVHPRMDFMLYAMDPIINQAANWHYMFGANGSVPVVIRGIINRGGEQGAQHSQALQALFAHIPGLKVVMPATPYDAKGMLVSAILDANPVVYIDDRRLYALKGEVPEGLYTVTIGEASVRAEGEDCTIIASSSMVIEALKASAALKEEGLSVEVLDLRTVKPLDTVRILASVRKAGRVVIADGGWKTCGLSAEVAALISEGGSEGLKAPIRRVALPDVPAPASKTLEGPYYPAAADIVRVVLELCAS